jgi:UDP-N-acetylglucosamine--N-acetylmuramyl-(pentapeptide) pyrophosphoryl-undecaprenol N-acetylglucosamine transferase
MSVQIRVLISGGGTGGHIFPAIAIADALKVAEPSIEILFIGAKGRMEMSRVPAAGYPIKGLWISGFQRRLTFRNLLFPIKLIWSAVQACLILLRFRPHAVIGVGGYASGPMVYLASWFGIHTAIQEQNALPGATNRLLGRRVRTVYTAYKGAGKYFDSQKIKCFGNPVRSFIHTGMQDRFQAASHFGLQQSKKTILVFGGSLGAGVFNSCMEEAFDEIAKFSEEVQWIWQSGQTYAERYASTKTASLPNVCFLPFIDAMDKAYALADLVICRAGAMALSELALLGKPCILVPSPFVAEDHQTVNASELAKPGAAIMISQAEAPSRLILTALQVISDEHVLLNLSNAIKTFAHNDAATAIANDLLGHIKEK